jgi:capsular exopolysaccharide synthesis family protein
MIKFSQFINKPTVAKPTVAVGAPHSATFADPVPANSRVVDLPIPLSMDFDVEEVHVPDESRLSLVSDPKGPGADRFRYLRMCLREVRAAAMLRSIVITSPVPEDGKSTIALNLATTLASSGKHTVLLMETDLHHPTLAKSLGIEQRPGIAECLEEEVELSSAIRKLRPLGWHLLQAGTPEGNATELLQGDAFARMLRTLSATFDWIVMDAPPVGPLTDAVSLSRLADATLLVVRAGWTPRDAVEEAMSLVGPERILGVVFNAAEGLNRIHSKYAYYYGKK